MVIEDRVGPLTRMHVAGDHDVRAVTIQQWINWDPESFKWPVLEQFIGGYAS
jgi:hypothetical protein